MICTSLTLLTVFSLAAFGIAVPIDTPVSLTPDYDVVIVGGGPAGLSAASAFGRVRDSALLIDSGEYRNLATQHMHDVIGNDGLVPAAFRELAREQISVYKSVSMMNGSVTSIKPGTTNGTSFTTTTADGKRYTSRKIVLATGVKDILSTAPGVNSVWGKGMYSCPWCDGWEHRDKPAATMGEFNAELLKDSIALTTLNADLSIFTNGTCTDSAQAETEKEIPRWGEKLSLNNIKINDRPIASFGRAKGNLSDYDDDIVITFTDGTSVTKNAILASFPIKLASSLARDLGLKIEAERVVTDNHMETTMPGVYMVGDANSDKSTNVPHAMWSGKRAGVYIHGALATERTQNLLNAATASKHNKRCLHADETFEAMKRRIGSPRYGDDVIRDLKRSDDVC